MNIRKKLSNLASRARQLTWTVTNGMGENKVLFGIVYGKGIGTRTIGITFLGAHTGFGWHTKDKKPKEPKEETSAWPDPSEYFTQKADEDYPS